MLCLDKKGICSTVYNAKLNIYNHNNINNNKIKKYAITLNIQYIFLQSQWSSNILFKKNYNDEVSRPAIL